ncbi:NAD(P)/FAD-dependent oxidoreductase [Auritidibacter ignavus]|uniref:phytoene desaturase family protein n=1 Tax=Auritidibacter ignavus TaxID=678932 RepID=UPI002FE55627
MPTSSPSRTAAIVGAGPNGLTAAALLAKAGWQVDVYERNARIGGASSSAEIFGPGTLVDLGAAAHPFGVASPVFARLRLTDHGLRWRHGRYPMAHPLDNGSAVVLHHSLEDTATELGGDGTAWRMIHRSLVDNIDKDLENVMGPLLRFPAHPVRMAQFGLFGSPPSTWFTRTAFRDQPARALFIGSAAHAITPLGHPFTSAYGAIFGALGMTRGWPVAEGGSQAISDALGSVITSHGGRIHTDTEITSLHELDAEKILLNMTPAQVMTLAGRETAAGLSDTTLGRLSRWRYGPGVYKVDYLLDGPVPWSDDRVGQAVTVHVGGQAAEIRLAEAQITAGRMPERPFVMVCQQQVADPSRTTDSRTILWTYAHVPANYHEPRRGLVAERIEAQISRFAPDFRDRILDRHLVSPQDLQDWNPNLIGGDIAGGAMTRSQAVLRPGLTREPYRLTDRLFMGSAATPPGAGVHGMSGYWAAQAMGAEPREA